MGTIGIVLCSMVTLAVILTLAVVIGNLVFQVMVWVARKLKIIPSHN